MSDIVERLRQGAGHLPEDISSAEKAMDEAAAEIKRLREALETCRELRALQGTSDAAEIERLTMQVDALNEALCKSGDERTQQAAEIERLHGEMHSVHAHLAHMRRETERLRTDNTGLRAALAKATYPEGHLDTQVAEWLRERGYSVSLTAGTTED